MDIESTTTWKRLEDQIGWYDKKSTDSQGRYKFFKITEILCAALVPVIAGLAWPTFIVGGLGALIVLLEGIQHLNQYQYLWHSYRSTCEYLKHEKYLFLAKAAHYGAVEKPETLLAERIESLISQEHAKWVSARTQMTKEKDKASLL